MKATSLTLNGLQAVHRGIRLGPIGFELPAGAHGCLLGPPGSGKSLMLRAVAGLAASTGSVQAGAEDPRRLPPGRRGFAYLARHGAPPPLASVGAVLGLARRARGLRAVPLAPWLAEWQLDAAADPARLDTDQRLRLRLAAAFASEPALLLLDRPFGASVDREALLAALRDAARRRGTTVLHATTGRDEAFAVADRLVLLEHGQVLQAGTASDLYDRPQSLFIAARTGAANILPGHIEQLENDTAFVRLAAGPLIQADPPPGPAGIGAACQVLLRPERIVLSPLAAAELGPGAIAAVLRDVTHLGATIRATVAIGADAELVVARPAGLGLRGLVAGRTVAIAWQSQHALSFLAADQGYVPGNSG